MNVDAPQSAEAHRELDQRSSRAGLRAVASFEAFKGVLVVILGVFLLVYHSQADDVTENLLEHLHMDSDARFGRMLMSAADKLSDAHLATIGAVAFTYSTVRFVEAWGLWNRRVWAEWFALLSGATYLPFELAKVVEKATWERVAIFGMNLVIVLYMAYIRLRERKLA